MAYQCPLCVFFAASLSLILSHLRLVHASDPGFTVTCGLSGCVSTFKKFRALYQHIYRKHGDAGIIQRRRTLDADEPGTSTSFTQDTALSEFCASERTTDVSEAGKHTVGVNIPFY